MRGMQALSDGDPAAIGGYALEARLGQGGFGVVYLGRSPGGLAVAIKVLRPEFLQVPGFLTRFRREVEAAQMVSSIYTAPVLKAGVDENPPWVATAYVAGPALDQVGRLPEPALWRLLAGLSEALAAIHAAGIIHRDLKPANVLLATDGPKVIDFGISKALDLSTMTSIGSVLGTPAFMSPEQAKTQDASPASDVFSLGSVLAYAATGRAPFGGGASVAVLYRVVHDSPMLDGIPEALRLVISRCLDKDPGRRPSLAELSAIGPDGPRGHAMPPRTAFWPSSVVALIRDYQDRADSEAAARVPSAALPLLPTRTAPPPHRRVALAPRQAAGPRRYHLARPAALAQALSSQNELLAAAGSIDGLHDQDNLGEGYAGARRRPIPLQARNPGNLDEEHEKYGLGERPEDEHEVRGGLDAAADEPPDSPDPAPLETAYFLQLIGIPVNLGVAVIYCIINFIPAGDTMTPVHLVIRDTGTAIIFVLLVIMWMRWALGVGSVSPVARPAGVAVFALYAVYIGFRDHDVANLTFSDQLLLVPGVLALVIILLLFTPSVNRFFQAYPQSE